MQWIGFPDDKLVVNGLYWFKENAPNLWRLPERAKANVREPVWDLARQPSGARIRFSSDTTKLAIKVDAPARVFSDCSMPSVTVFGFDVYSGGKCWACREPEPGNGVEVLLFEGAPRVMRDFTIHLPLYSEVKIKAVGVIDDAKIGVPPGFALDKPMTFYGTSIVHGAAAGRPGLSYPAILGRMLNLDFINLGFSGNGKCEPEIAEIFSEVDACIYVIDAGRNHVDRAELEPVYQLFVQKVREAHPDAPIICVTPFHVLGLTVDPNYRPINEGLRDVVRETIAGMKNQGDKDIHLVEGDDLLGPDDTDGLEDHAHPNTLGFMRVAERLAPQIRKLLNL